MKIIAEISANHNGSLNTAMELVKAAAQTGADYVKFQTFTPESMVADKEYALTDGPWAGMRLIDLYDQAQTPWEWHEKLFEYARELGITPMSSPFSAEAVDFLETLDCPIYKIASFELTDSQLIKKVAQTGKPMVMSTGMATEEEVFTAVYEAKKWGCEDVTLMQCTSSYPADESDANLATMVDMKEMGVDVGLSDHTLGNKAAMIAVALGASVIEKHIMLKGGEGLDAGFSLEPDEFAEMVKACRSVKDIIGKVQYQSTEDELSELRRTLYFSEDIPTNTIIESKHIKTARVAKGLHPKFLSLIIGKTLINEVTTNKPVAWEDFNADHIRKHQNS